MISGPESEYDGSCRESTRQRVPEIRFSFLASFLSFLSWVPASGSWHSGCVRLRKGNFLVAEAVLFADKSGEAAIDGIQRVNSIFVVRFKIQQKERNWNKMQWKKL